MFLIINRNKKLTNFKINERIKGFTVEGCKPARKIREAAFAKAA